jgi:hypothetical protein
MIRFPWPGALLFVGGCRLHFLAAAPFIHGSASALDPRESEFESDFELGVASKQSRKAL